MSCACIRKFYDFDIVDTGDCSDVLYIDRSDFQEGYTGIPSYTLTIENSRGEKTEHSVTQGIPLHLDFSCKPDVYTFQVTSCTEVFTKRTAILCELWCGYLKAVAKLGKGVEYETVRSIRERLEYIPLIANTDFETAIHLTRTVQRDLLRINCECSCS